MDDDQVAAATGMNRPDGAIMVGSADQITAKLLAARGTFGLDRIFAQVDWGGLPSGMVTDSIARYATRIAPERRSG
jgi:hypothetical protein